MAGAPPGWPRMVPPPRADGWVAEAAAWLLDNAPAEYRTYPLIRRHPVILAWLVKRHTAALLDAARSSYGSARAELASHAAPHTVTELLTTLEQEGARLVALQREVDLVWAAISREHP